MIRYIRLLFISLLMLVAFTLKAQPTQLDFSAIVRNNGCNLAEYKFDVTTLKDAMNVDLLPSNYFYYWDFGNGSNSGSPANNTAYQNQLRTYIAPGDYTVTLYVYASSVAVPTNSPAPIITISKTVRVFANPTPDFSANIVDVCLGDPITVTDNVNYAAQPFVGPVLSRRWNFGNGTFFDVTNPLTNTYTYTYPNVGDYQITLTTRTSGGRPTEECTANRSRPMYIRVRHRPVASFVINPMPPACSLPYAPTLTNTSTIASTPPPAGSITTYIWRFYNGLSTGPLDMPFLTISTGSPTAPILPANTYTMPGSYAITLQATSSTGCPSTVTATQILTIPPPTVADFNVPTATVICAGTSVSYIDNSTAGVASYAWNFSGPAVPSTSTSANPSVQYSASGTYNTTLTVTYPNGCVRTVTKPYTVTVNPVPNANFTNTPNNGFCSVNKIVTFAPLVYNPNYTYTWNFGQPNGAGPGLPGPVAVGQPTTGVGTGTYLQFGTYNVTLTVKDNVTLCETTVTKPLTLQEPILSIVPRNPVSGCAPLNVVFDISMNAIESIVEYQIDYGSGFSSVIVPTHNPPTPFTVVTNNTYTTRGTFIPKVRIRTVGGCVFEATSATPIRVGTPPVITGVTRTGGAGGNCQGGGFVYTPIFQAGTGADVVMVSYGGATAVPYVPGTPFPFPTNGSQSITYTAFDNGCLAAPFTFSGAGIGGPIEDPIPSITINGGVPNICNGGATNTFSVNITGSIPSPNGVTNYIVDFAGTQYSSLTPTAPNNPFDPADIKHTFTSPGTYTITVIANNPASGCSASRSVEVTVIEALDFVVDFNITTPTPTCSFNPITFDATATTASASGVTITNYQWNFGDGSPIFITNNPITTKTYVPNGSVYPVTLTVLFSNGCTKTYTGPARTVNIQGPIPAIAVSPTINGCVGDSKTFTGSISGIFPNSNVVLDPSGYTWNFGDPSSVSNIVNGQMATHTFVNPGTYTVTLTVRDNNTLTSNMLPGCLATRTVQVQIFPKPTVSFTAPAATCVDKSIRLTSMVTGTGPFTYEWDFDGNLATVESTTPSPDYQFPAATTPLGTVRNQVVTLKVTNANGCFQTFTRNISVINPDFAISANGVVAPMNLTMNCPPATVNFRATPIPANLDLTNWTFDWTFGDGNQAINVQNPSNIYDTPQAPKVFNIEFVATNTITGCEIRKPLNNFVTVTGPRGVFSFVPKNLCKPSNVVFTAGSFTGSPIEITMDYGDGQTETRATMGSPSPFTETFTHKYTQSGSFLPIMTLIDASGCRVAYPSPSNTRVNVSGNPVADFTWTNAPNPICINVPVNFTDLSTRDSGTPLGNPLNPQINQWDWAIYPAGTPIPVFPALPAAMPLTTSTSQNTSYTFPTPGTYLVRLSVRTAFNQGGTAPGDAVGCPAFVYKQVQVVIPDIDINISPVTPTNICANEIATFSGRAKTNNVSPNTLVGTWNVYTNPVAGVTNNNPANLINSFNAVVTAGIPWNTMAGNYAFPASGSYTVELAVRDLALCAGQAIATQEVVVNPLPTFAPASGPANQAICVTQTADFSVIPSTNDVTFQWQQNDGSGWINIADGTLAGGLAPAAYVGTTTAAFRITNGTMGLNGYRYRCVIRRTLTTLCIANSASATLTVNQIPTTANAGPAQTLCNQTLVTLAGNNVAPFTGQWTQVGGTTLPAGSIVNASLFNTQVNNLQLGIYTFRWTSSSGACASNFDDVVITNVRTANAGPNQNLCGASTVTLAANNPTLFGGTGVWSLVSGPVGATPLITPTNGFNPTVTGLVPSTTPYVFRWTTSGPGCSNNSFADVTINDRPLPSAVNPMSQTICEGQNATFATSGAGTYQWQVDNNSGGGFLNLGNIAPHSGVTTQTLTVTNPLAATFSGYKYRVRVTAATGCVTFTNFGVLTIQASPLGTPSASASAICQGSPLTISLTNTTSTYIYQLFVGATPVAGVPVITGNGAGQSFASFTPSATATYSVVVTTPLANGVNCTQTLTPTLPVTVNPTPSPSVAGANQVICATSTNMNATPVASGTGTWTIIAGSGSIAAVQQNNPTAPITGLTAGVTTLQWTVSSGSGVGACPPNISTVNVTNLGTTATSNAGADQTLCAAATALQGSNPGVGTGTWSVTSGSGVFANANDRFTTVTGLGIGTNTFRWTVIDACGTTTDDVNIIREFGNTFADAGPNVIQCGVTVNLSAVGTPAAASRTWTLPSGVSLVTGTDLTSPNISVTGLSMGANVFTWTVTNSCATSISNVTITRIDNTTPSNAGVAQNVCGVSTALNANIPAVGTGTWSFISGPVALTNANFSNINQNNATVSGMTAVGTYRFQWAITNGACTPSSTFVDITRDALPSASVITAIPDICADNTNITATNPTTGAGLWSVVSSPSGANPTFVNAASNSTTINGLTVAGTYTIRWTVTNGTCPPSQSTATIVRASPPTVSNAGIAQTICADVVTLNANSPTSGTGLWTVTSPSGASVTFANATANNTTASGLTVAGNYTFTWTISNTPCTPASSSNVIITRNATIGAVTITPSTIDVCGASTTLTASALPAGATGLWTIVQGNGIFSPANNPTTNVSGLSAGLNRFRWTVTSGVCPQVSADVVVNSFTQPAAANAGADVLVCGTIGNLSASTPTAGTGTWSYVGTAPSGLSFGNINSPNTTVSGLPVGSHTLRWTVNNLPCTASSDDVSVSVRGSVSLSVAGTSQTTCNTNWTLGANSVNVVAGETGTWTFSGGTIASGDITNPNAPATLVLGVNSFTWTVTNGCATSVSTIFITRVDNTTIANAGINQDICINDVNLAGNQPAIGTGTWTSNAGNPSTVTFANASQYNTSVSGLNVAGDYFFTWTITNGNCTPSSSIVRIRRLANPSLANIGTSSANVCADNYTITTGTAPTIGTGLWSVVSGSGTFSSNTDVNTQISNLANGVNVFRWTVSNATCTPTTATITITRALPPTASVAGINASICADTYTLNGNAPTVGVGQWTLQPGFPAGAVVTFNNNSLSNAVANGLTLAGTYTFRWTITNSPCTASTSDVIVTKLEAPTANAGTNITQCGGQIFMNATGTPLGNGTWSVVAGNGTFANPNSPTTEVIGMGQGLNRYRWTVTNGTCTPATSEVIVNYSAPLSNAFAGADVTVCDVNGILNATAPAVGSGQWVLISPTTGILPTIANPNSPNSAVTGLVLGNNIFEWRVSNAICTTPNTDQVILTRRGNTVLSNAGTSSSTCLATINLNANIPNVAAGEVGTWSVAGGASIAAVDLNNPTATATLVMGPNSFTWTVVNGCATATSTITITRTIGVTPSIAGNNQSICTNTTALNGNIPSAGTGQWIVTSVPAPLTLASVTFVDAFSTTTQVNGLTQAGNYILTWRIDNGACGVSQSNVQITVIEQPSASVITTAPISICDNNINLQATAPAVGNGQWSVASAPIGILPVFANANSNNTNVTGLNVAGNYRFAWTTSNGICPTSTSQVTISVVPSTFTANGGSAQDLCSSVTTTNLTGNTVAGTTGAWTQVSGAAAILANASTPNLTVNGLTTGTYTFRWTLTGGNCPPSTSDVIVRVAEPANAGPDQNLCSVTVATLAGNTPVVGTGTWTQVSGATAIISSLNSPTSGITGLTTGTYTFRWTVTGSPCGTTTDDIVINVVGNASAGVNQVICNTANTTLAATAPVIGTGTWTATPSAGVMITNPTSPSSTVSGLTLGTVYTFTWTITGTPCVLTPQNITITVSPLPNAGTDQALCNVTTATLAGNTPLGGATGTWSQIAGASASISNINSPTSGITGLNTGTYTFRWTFTGGSCATSSDDMVITVTAPANAGINQNLCAVSTTNLAATPPITGIGTWTKISGPIGGAIVSANSATTSVTGLVNGTYVFQWEVTGGACPTTNASMTILVSSPADAGTDISVCGVTSVTLAALAPTTGTGAWSQISGPSTAAFSGNVFNATASNLQTGTYTFRWTISGSACTPSFDDVVVRVSENANAGADQAVCNVTSATLAGNIAVTGIGTWTQVSGNPATITSPTSPTSTVTGLITGSYTFQWTFTGGTCGNSNDQVVINVSAPTSAGTNQSLCGATFTNLSATAPVAGTGLWTQILGPGIASISNTGIINPTVSGLLTGTYVFRWTITGVPCPNLFSEVTIINSAVPNAGANQTICLGSPMILQANTPTVGTGQWSQISGASTALFTNASSPTSTVTNLTVGTYIFRWTVTGATCSQNTSDVTMTVIGVTPTNASASVSDTEYCDNQIPPSATVTVGTTQNGVRYELRKTDNSLVASQVSAGNSLTFTITPAPTSTTTYTVVAIPNIGAISCTPVELADKGIVTVKVCEKQSIGIAKTVLPLVVQPNGSVNVTYLLTVRNLGNTELTNIQINDDLTTVFPAPATYSIVSPPSASGGLLSNTGYTGTAANPNLLTGLGRLSAGETQTVSFTVNLIPNALSGSYINSAVARGERGSVVVTDRSTDGVNVDPDNDGDPRENTPTPFTLPANLSRPRIGVAKNLFATSRQANGSYNITYQMTVRNYGNVELTNIQIVDDLVATFPSPAQFSIVGTPSSTGSLTANASYTGRGATNVLVNGGRLAAGESQTVVLTVNLIPNTTNATYRNTAIGTGSAGGINVTDNSTDGINPDPNGDGNPSEESPTLFTLPTDNNNNNNRPLLGVAKSLTTVARQTDGSYNLTYSISMRNYGNVALSNLQVSDDLTATFPAPAVFRIVGAPSATGSLTANSAFTGTGSNANLLNGGTLAIGETQTITFSVNLTPNAAAAFYRNTAVGSGENGTNRITDSSTDGLNPDPNGDGSPDENIPTLFSIPADRPQIGVAKNLLSAVRQANGSFNLTYLVTLRNYGNIALANVQVTDNLTNTFPSPAQFSVTTQPLATGNLVGNTGFTGTGGNINLLSGGSLGIGERQSITFTVNMTPNTSAGSFRNTAIGRGEGGGIPTTDTSTDGLNPDPDNNGNPSEESPTIFNLPTDNNNNRPLIGVAKNLLTPVRQADGSYNFTYQINVRNYGNAEITNVQVIDDLTATFPAPATFRVISAPTSIGNLTTNPNYTGRAGNNNLLNGSGRLGIGESQTITFTVNVIPNANGATYRNTAIGTGSAGGINVTDNSSEGSNPDPNGDGNPTEDVPTTFVLQPETNVTPIATRFAFTTDNCSSTILTEKIILQNSGLVKITLLPKTVTPLRGVVSISTDGTMIYRPALNAVGLDSLEYEICNSINVCARGKIYINVLACTSQPPAIRPDEFGTDNCTEVRGNVLTNDTDPNGTVLKAKVVTNRLTVSGGVYSIAADGTFSYLPPKGFVGRDSMTYEACNSVQTLSKCGTAKIYVDVLDCQETFIPEGFSPNGDGVNDVFTIKGAERFDIKLQIYNRWGNLVYEDDHYKNTWGGVATIGILIGEGVPDGTYYYIVDFRNNQKPKVGFLTVQR